MSKRTVLFKRKVRQTNGTPEAVARLFREGKWATKPEKVQQLKQSAGVR